MTPKYLGYFLSGHFFAGYLLGKKAYFDFQANQPLFRSQISLDKLRKSHFY